MLSMKHSTQNDKSLVRRFSKTIIQFFSAQRRISVSSCTKLIAAFVCALTLFSVQVRSQSYSDKEFLQYPRAFERWHFQNVVGFNLTVLPRAIVEEEIRQFPLLSYEARIGLPWNFSATGKIGSNVITNLGSISTQWSYSFGRFACAVGDEVAFWYGFSEIDGFDLTAQGWLNFPHVTVGFAFDDFMLSVRAETQIITFQSTVAGETEVKSNKNAFSGFALGFVIEQPFWKNQHVKLGLKINYSKQMYQSWLAFSTFQDYLFYPEFSFGFIF